METQEDSVARYRLEKRVEKLEELMTAVLDRLVHDRLVHLGAPLPPLLRTKRTKVTVGWVVRRRGVVTVWAGEPGPAEDGGRAALIAKDAHIFSSYGAARDETKHWNGNVRVVRRVRYVEAK